MGSHTVSALNGKNGLTHYYAVSLLLCTDVTKRFCVPLGSMLPPRRMSGSIAHCRLRSVTSHPLFQRSRAIRCSFENRDVDARTVTSNVLDLPRYTSSNGFV